MHKYSNMHDIKQNLHSDQMFLKFMYTVEPPLMDILYSEHLIIQDKMSPSGLNLHYA